MMVSDRLKTVVNSLAAISLEKQLGQNVFAQVANKKQILSVFKYKNITNLRKMLLSLPEDDDDPLFSLPKSYLAICAFGEIKYKRRKSEYIRFFCDYNLTWYMYFIYDGIDCIKSNYGMLLQQEVSL